MKKTLTAESKPKTRPKFATRREVLARLEVSPQIEARVRHKFPVLWPDAYLDLVGPDPATDPIARLGRPSEAELLANAGDLSDPVADLSLRPIPFVVRKHEDRVIILSTKRCHFYCRFCFRRAESFHETPEPGPADWERIYQFLKQEEQIREPILSGGDPLTLSDEKLAQIGQRLAQIHTVERWRIHSRAPVHFPQRITAELVSVLQTPLPLLLVTHFNHPRELTDASIEGLRRLQHAGIELQNQAVLLNGVNDDVTVQTELWQRLAALEVGARYLHHPDRAPGNGAFRVTIARGLGIYESFRKQLLQAPEYVIDLPDGRGKVPVVELKPQGEGEYHYSHCSGEISHYLDWDV